MNAQDARRWKLKDQDGATLASFEATARNLGWDRKLYEKALDSFVSLPSDVRSNPEHLGRWVGDFLGKHGRGEADLAVLTSWLGDVMTVGPPPAAAPTAEDDATRLAAIREARRNGQEPDGWAEHDELAIIERAAPAKASPDSGTVTQLPDWHKRLAEIREMRRADPSSYDNNKALQAEELSLLENRLSPAASSAGGAPGSALDMTNAGAPATSTENGNG